MTNYISIKNSLRLIPKGLLKESSQADFLSWMLDAVSMLPQIAQTRTEIKVFEFSDYKMELPEYIKQLNLVTYLDKDPCEEDLSSVTSCVENPESEGEEYSSENVCRYTLNYKMFLDSSYYNNNFIPLKYSGPSGNILCSNCPNRFVTCANTFWIDHNKILHTSLKEGFLCIDYDAIACDDGGDYMVIDLIEVENYLAKYAIYKHWEERSNLKEESALRMYQTYQQEAEIAFKRAKGKILLGFTDLNTVAKVVGNTYQKLIKIPDRYVYAR